MKKTHQTIAAIVLLLAAGLAVWRMGNKGAGGLTEVPVSPAATSEGTAPGAKATDREVSIPRKARKPPVPVKIDPAWEESVRRAAILDLFVKRGLRGLSELLLGYTEEFGLPPWLQGDLQAVIQESYLRGELGTASELFDVIGGGYRMSHNEVFEVCETLVSTDQPQKAFLELLQTPTQTSPNNYRYLFGKVGSLIGYEKALGQVAQFGTSESAVARVASEQIFRSWLHKDPEQALEHVENLPDSHDLRHRMPEIMADVAIEAEEFETARKWLDVIKDPKAAARVRNNLEISERER